MNNRKKYWIFYAFFLSLMLGSLAGISWWAFGEMPSPSQKMSQWLENTATYLLIALFVLVMILGQIWSWLDKAILEPLDTLTRSLAIIASADSGHELKVDRGHLIGELPDVAQQLADSLHQARYEVRAALASRAEVVEQLEMVIKRLKVGVIVFDEEARVLLYNPASQHLFDEHSTNLGLGRSLYGLFNRLPIATTMELLQHRSAHKNEEDKNRDEARFFCTTLNGSQQLDCFMSLARKSSNAGKAVFVMTFEEVTKKMDTLKRSDHLMRSALEKLRSPLANLRAAAENLSDHPDMEDSYREKFYSIIQSESIRLSDRFEAISQEARSLVSSQWILTDTHTEDLADSLSRCLEVKAHKIQITLSGIPLWLQADGPSFLVALETLLLNIFKLTSETNLKLESLMGDKRVYLDFVWKGEPIPNALIESWMGQELKADIGSPTLGEVMDRHGGELWSQRHRDDGYSLLRIPVSASPRQWESPQKNVMERPEFHDFSIQKSAKELGRLAASSLLDLTFVVFDTETTGLHPSGGDEIISIAGVRIVNGRILSGETFEALIDPGRPIPPASTRIHGITDDQVKGKPTIETVLPQFKAFTKGAILVAHNAAFDMKFLQMKEDATDVWFDNPVLDTLLLSVYLHDEMNDHTLDAIAKRLGVEIHGRHTALGDAEVTAEVFVKLMELLKAKGISSLGLTIQASESMVQMRRQQMKENY
ncbi:MAG: histidine kinase [Magnetococcales bacterium]|nr:histidine kinase [Magnetococcales bacterium]